ncbi:MAG: YciK family oxidoreductase [Porticoccaceae bacterium]
MPDIILNRHIPDGYSAADDSLRDRVILVTGAGDGIGRTAALTFARYGATVILAGRTQEKLEAVYDSIEHAGYPQAAIYAIDLEHATEADYTALAEQLESEFSRLDGLLHNAAALGERTSIANYSLASWNQVMAVNVNAQFMLSKALLPLLKKSADASIVFTSSGVGRTGRAFWGAYAASKFATEGLSQILAAELENTSNIRVNCINPGATRTRMRAAAFPAEDPATIKTPEDIMPTYMYLMGPDSKGVTGQSIDAQ